MFSSGQLGIDIVIVQCYAIVAGCSCFGFVAESRPVSILRFVRRAGVQLQFPGSGHNQKIPQVGMARTTEMGMAESYYGGVVVLITGTVTVHGACIFPIYGIRDGIGVRAELYHTKRDGRTGKYMPHFLSADHGIHILRQVFSFLLCG